MRICLLKQRVLRGRCAAAELLIVYCAVLFTCGTAAWADKLRDLEFEAERAGVATWGHWGDNPAKYNGYQSHSNRLIPLYTFGISLDAVRGANSVYRSEERLKELFGYVPDHTHNPSAEYFDQTDVYRLQKQAVAEGKKYIFLIIFDGMDWETTRIAAQYKSGKSYASGRGAGLAFQDYRGTATDFGFFVTTPSSSAADFDVSKQVVLNAATGTRGGYDPAYGGDTPWSPNPNLPYLIGRNKERPHAVADSSCTAAAMTTGMKSYNASINLDRYGRHARPIAVELQEGGWLVGAVTSVPVPHATPGCAYANNVTRNDYQDISRDMIGLPSSAHPATPLSGLDVVIGCGWGVTREKDAAQGDNYVSGNRYVHEADIAASDVVNGGKYHVVQRTNGKSGGILLQSAAKEAAAKQLRLFGFFGTEAGNLPFATADGEFDPTIQPEAIRAKFAGTQKALNLTKPYQPADITENPTLAEMTDAALTVLAAKPEQKFWLMIESGDVDWASHSNNLDSAVGAIYSGERAFEAVVRWIEARSAWQDSVILLTADHGHLFVPTDLDALKP